MESWDSQLEIFNHLNPIELKEKLAEFITKESSDYGSYEFAVYQNGICVHNDITGISWDGYERGKHLDCNSPEFFEFEEQDDKEQKEANAKFLPLLEDAKKLAKQSVEEQKKLILKQKALEAENQKIKDQENRRKQYEQLKKEFEHVDR